MSRRPNQISLKDLFSTNPGELLGGKYASDSALDSASQGNSQYPYSQMELFDSQDGQQFHHPQSLSQSPTTRFFNRYMSKGSGLGYEDSQTQIVRPNSTSGIGLPRLPSQQQIQLLKTKTQKLEERDLWNSIVFGIRECSAEVRVAVACMKENTQLNIGSAECQLTAFLEKIQLNLEKSQRVIIDSLSIHDKAATKEVDLKQQVATKDVRINELQNLVQRLEKEMQDGTATSLRDACNDLCQNIKDSLEPLFVKNLDALIQYEVAQKQCHEVASEQMKELLKQNFNEQHESVKSFVKETLSDMQRNIGWLEKNQFLAELKQSLHFVLNNDKPELEDILCCKVKKVLEEEELQLKQLFEHQHRLLLAVYQENLQEMFAILRKEMEHSSNDHFQQLQSKMEQYMSQGKDHYLQLHEELHNLNNFYRRYEKQMKDDNTSLIHSLPVGEDFCSSSKDNFLSLEKEPVEARRENCILSKQFLNKNKDIAAFDKTKCDIQIKNVESSKSLECGKMKTPASAFIKKFFINSAIPSASNSDRVFEKRSTITRPLPQTVGLSSGNYDSKGLKLQNRRELQWHDSKILSPTSLSNRTMLDQMLHFEDNVNPSPVALVLPQVQSTSISQHLKEVTLPAAPKVEHVNLSKTPLPQVVPQKFASPCLMSYVTPARTLTRITKQLTASTAMTVSKPLPTSQATAMSKHSPEVKQLTRIDGSAVAVQKKFTEYQSDKVISNRRDGLRSGNSQNRKRPQKLPVTEIELTNPYNKRTAVEVFPMPNDKASRKKIGPTRGMQVKQSITCKAASSPNSVFDFSYDDEVNEENSPKINKTGKIVKKRERKPVKCIRKAQPNTERVTNPDTYSSRKQPPQMAACNKSTKTERYKMYISSTEKLSTSGRAPFKERSTKINVVSSTRYDDENANVFQEKLRFHKSYNSSSASSSPCFSLSDILKRNET